MAETGPAVNYIGPLDPLPGQGEFLLITRTDRLRGSEFFIDSSPDLRPRLPPRIPAGDPAMPPKRPPWPPRANLAHREGVPAILVQNRTVRGRPDWPVW